MIERSDLSMAQLRKNITSKGGTTQAGLDTLSQYDLVSIFEDCLNAAVSIELSNIEDQSNPPTHVCIIASTVFDVIFINYYYLASIVYYFVIRF